MAGSVNFVTIGITQSVFGPSFDAFSNAFAVPAAAVSLVVSVFFAGGSLSILAAGMLVRRFGYRRVLTSAMVALGLGALLMALAPAWPVVLVAAGLIGVGFGTQNVSTNLLVVRAFGGRAGPVVNFIGAVFGIGSVLGPLLVGLLLPSWRVPFMILAGLAVLASLVNIRVFEPGRETAAAGAAGGRVLALLASFILLFFVYVAAEVGVASWEATHLSPYVGPERAAFLTSLFWLSVTAGRFVAMPVSAFVRPPTLVMAAALLAVGGAVFALNPTLAPYAYMVMGFAFAPIFPTALVWLQQALPGRTETFVPFVMAAANMGPVLTAPLIGLAVTRQGSDVVPLALLVITGVLVLITTLLLTQTARRPASAT